MAGEWRETALGDVLELKRGYDLPQQLRTPGLVPVVSSSGTTDYVVEAMVKGPGVVTGRYGTLGQVFFIPADFWPLNTTLYVRDFKGNDPRFISYFLRALDFSAYSDKAAVPGLNRNHLHQAKVKLPTDVAEQRAIAHILGALDDKIELNRRLNATLEAMARALFKSWFVDFDPVCANMEGRDTGLPPELAALFPDGLVESELGEVPDGWEVEPIGELADIAIGGDWGEDSQFDGAIQVICLRGVDLEHLRSEGWADAPQRWVTALSVEKRLPDERDVLIAGSGAGPTGRPLWAGAHLHRLWNKPVIYSNFCKRLRCRSRASAIYLDRWLHVMRESGEIWEYVNGTSLPNLDAHALLRGKQLVMPNAQVLELFAGYITPIARQLFSAESRTLAALRDALLPKLLSGEVRVGDLDREGAK
jgi:type I restriction enzyme, S subunit